METQDRKGNRRPCLFRERDVTRAIRAVVSSGQKIKAVKIEPDGGILVLVSENGIGNDNPEISGYNEWDEVLK